MIDAWFCYWLIVCKTSVQSNRMQERDVHALHLRAGFGDFGDGHDGIACMGVGCESDDRKGFVGWDGRLDHNLYIEPECRFGTQQVDSPHRSLGLSRIVVLSTDYETMRFAQQTYSIVVGFP